ncbi:TPA: asparaginase [Staphylococcus aureus]|uniref:asparaginase n=2 Tax=Staphylococcus aureus TaxID=1280 RepID=A0A2S6DCJ4_STAAU|nr:asparaginase [Staphylococcus aureus]HDH6211604.1 asparaginase [Staphylococcus aureus LTCF-12-55]HDH6225160.1 asparaginase [Staphylococcus aureus LTCF-12-46]HDH6263774.1 asparaginase [Staphylococcus aureus LTCF-7-30]HDH6421171.1 asparaginase [Staphylococcus aureus MRSA-Lux-33]HDH6423765.1 asparaginase [Staphylococcus aureus MRSA-Lux-34]HDH6426276.1 asparaginase [Staphylococcus aureus MRSA-Lux-32]HDH6428811.1 asparaginase [Staphylococcus aureus MRSA-Lux-31]HDX9043444.1 asparaginase [Staphy
MKHLLVIHTGGTISMSQDQSNKVVTNDINPISLHQDVINQYAQIDELNPFNVPSPHMTIQHVKQLKDIILEAVTNKYYDGFVITHGTDTLEETAFLLDLILGIEQPVVITGAMRSSNEIGSDGLYNYISAIRVASDEKARHKGVMVVFNDEIHTARNVTKTHTSNTNTFQSPNHGPLGVLTKDRVQFHHMPYRQQALENVNEKLNVPLVKAYMGLPGDIFSFYSREGIDGMVIEALGQGNIPPSALEGIQQLVSLNIPIVLVSRSFNGIVSPTYAYDGGGYQLAQQGFIFSNGLNGPKARLKLLVALSNNLDKAEIKSYFEL